MALDLSGDWAVFDDPVTVTYAVKTAEGAWAAGVNVTNCQQEEITKEDVEQEPALLEKDATAFHLWAAKLALVGAIVPKIGDKILYSSSLWIVRSVGKLDRDSTGYQRYRCVCTRSQGSQSL